MIKIIALILCSFFVSEAKTIYYKNNLGLQKYLEKRKNQSLQNANNVFSLADDIDAIMHQAELLYQIPNGILQAIAMVESGRNINGKITPWPWTINVEGEGHFFKTKEEAISAIRKFQLQGKKSIDVGYMQINLKSHPHAFKDLQQAFDAKINILYAAEFLNKLYQKHKNWSRAVECYHSANRNFSIPYMAKVFKKLAESKRVNSSTPLNLTSSISHNNQQEKITKRNKDLIESYKNKKKHIAENNMQKSEIKYKKYTLPLN